MEWIRSPLWRAVLLSNIGEIEFEMSIPQAREHLTECGQICGEEGEYATGRVASLLLAEMAFEEGAARSAFKVAAEIESSSQAETVKVRALATLTSFALQTGQADLAI